MCLSPFFEVGQVSVFLTISFCPFDPSMFYLRDTSNLTLLQSSDSFLPSGRNTVV
jgi:hypothetical protein